MAHSTNCKRKLIRKITLGFLSFAIIINTLSLFCSADAIQDQNNETPKVVIHRKHENSEMKIALTFDDGPHPRYTPKILEILKKYDIKATFFTVGINAYYYSETYKSVLDSGHEIGNHTDTHPHLRGINGALLFEEVEKCENAIKSVTGVTPTLFRPPEGVIEDSAHI